MKFSLLENLSNRSHGSGDLKLPFSLFLALRYLKPKRTFLSIITLISVIGVTLGVTVLILVISVMTGFDRELQRKVIDFDAHILVSTEDVMRNWRELTVKLNNTPGVVATAPFIQGPVIVEFQNRRLAPMIRGIAPQEEEAVIPLKKFIVRGKLDLEGDSTVLGIELARKLGIDVGDKLTVYSPGNLNEILNGIKKLENAKGDKEKEAIDELRDVILPKELTVTGIYETGHYLHDSEFLLVPIYVGQELYRTRRCVARHHGENERSISRGRSESTNSKIPGAARIRADMAGHEQTILRSDPAGAKRHVLSFVLHRRRRGVRNHEHAHYRYGAEAARDRHHESDRRQHLADRVGVSWAGNCCRLIWNTHRTWSWHDIDPVSERVQSLACDRAACRNFPARSLPILIHSRGSDSDRCREDLHQRFYYLLTRGAHSRIFRRAPRSSESLALRIITAEAAENAERKPMKFSPRSLRSLR